MTATLRTLLTLAWRTDRRAFLAMAVFLALGAVSQGLVGVFLRALTDTATAGHGAQASLWGLAAGAALATGVALGRAELALMEELAERMGLSVQEEILTLTSGVPTIEHLERPAYLDKLTTLRDESRQLYFAVWALALVAEHAVQIGLGVVLMAAVHPLVTLLLGGAVLPSLLVRGRAARHVDAATERTAETARLEQHLSESVTTPRTAKEIRLSRAAPALEAMAAHRWEEVSAGSSRAGVRAALLTFAGSGTFLAGYVSALGCAAWLAAQGRATPGDVVLVATVGVQLVTQASRLAFHVGSVAAGLRAAARLAWLRAYARTHTPASAESDDDAPHARARAATKGHTRERGRDHSREHGRDHGRDRAAGGAEPPESFAQGITLRNVSFTYPGTTRPVLRGIDLSLPAGATVALVGSHGSGKTTLVKLLCGLYQPSGGEILLDGVPLRDVPAVRWRSRISAVFQDWVPFELTAAETVGIGDLPRMDDRTAVDQALERAGATEVVAGLPRGLDTELGDSFEGGMTLSGGQGQRLALARASMREEPLLLVLDEPTASLDAPAESAVFARYAQAARRHRAAITLLITHRFPTVRMADLIVVLDGGRIAEQGGHGELMARQGRYAELHAIQRAAADG
ncbi:ABC transporter ATP-binding protein [Nonomuraea diastatica]|uniref:ABC transporter ATP-binding protein n=1 Tax=Nonomuraea diastatica TaxID=1848329 RepID=A0A4R4WKV4_9ACTN|nr:ABC transporter ATP-binding protein [Nonomuraea diastatica]TDD19918.1 ABC transporter ATP-binding protein [Nonomuraea diastatica]